MTLADATIVVVAGHQDGADAAAPQQVDRLPQDLRGIPAAAELRTYGVADVPAERAQELVELEAERRTADHDAVDLGDEIGVRDEVSGQVVTVLPAVHQRDVVGPGQVGPIAVRPVSALGVELRDRCRDVCLVLERQAAELQVQRWIFANGWAASSSYASSRSVCSSP